MYILPLKSACDNGHMRKIEVGIIK